ncbi:hypothetical protein JQ594_05180 [Bradyrhizobium manausense]|uniref:hypothetical protein n=1 Tax=Bradyrhizobium manausense TaxID=989370 RepID=UPI001BA9474B|nr:hypothetical protein [Bradyrhizobium manausense]MBR0685297.1 hypothetical protein [Bradyrhizobium manausense]
MPVYQDDYADDLAKMLAGEAEFSQYLDSDSGKRSQALGERLASARATAWKPLDGLAVALDRLDSDGAPIVWLDAAVDLMAFGSEDPDTLEVFEQGARRYQASRALCAAAHVGDITLFAGKRGRPVDRRQLDFSRKLGAEANTLEIDRSEKLHDSAAVFDEEFKTLKLVRIDRAALVAWLRERCGLQVSAETQELGAANVVNSIAPKKHKGGPGRRPRADWDAVGLALRAEISERGFPDDDNEDVNWRRQADVEEWAAELLKQRKEPIKESRRREKVAELLKTIKAGN